MSHACDRMAVLRGRFRAPPALPRPPWSSAAFADACDGCGDCVPACDAGLVAIGPDGRAGIDFGRGACTFCGDCATACPTAALDRDGAAASLYVADVGPDCISLNGIVCRICDEQCPTGAIRSRPLPGGRSLPVIDAARCDGCGACVAPCPPAAIRMIEARP